MPATSASVEILFSVAGQGQVVTAKRARLHPFYMYVFFCFFLVVTAKRARLHPSTVTLLVFLHEAITKLTELNP